jgi:IclR family acetate operon transcriptional repressor
VPSRHSMRMFTEVGRRVPVHCTGVGKVLLAQLPPAEVRAILARAGMAAQTPHTITDPDRLERELERIRAQGYAVDDAEQELGVRCLAVVVPGGPASTALSVSGPETRVTWAAVERIVPMLQVAAGALAGQLDARGAMT